MPDSPVYLATLEESHSHTPIREICSEGVIPLDDLLQKISPKSYTPEQGAHTSQTTDRQTTDDRQTDLPCHQPNVTQSRLAKKLGSLKVNTWLNHAAKSAKIQQYCYPPSHCLTVDVKLSQITLFISSVQLCDLTYMPIKLSSLKKI